MGVGFVDTADLDALPEAKKEFCLFDFLVLYLMLLNLVGVFFFKCSLYLGDFFNDGVSTGMGFGLFLDFSSGFSFGYNFFAFHPAVETLC